jgi:hypothetical protein
VVASVLGPLQLAEEGQELQMPGDNLGLCLREPLGRFLRRQRAGRHKLAESAVMVPPGGPEWDSMFAAASGAPFPPGATIDITPIEVVALSNEWAYEFGTSITTYTPEDAKESRQLRDTYLILLRNTGEG